jgi:GTP-binding protein LepA
MIFDSVYDAYRGVVTYVRMVDGKLEPRERIQMMSTRATHDLLEIGVSSPEPVPTRGLGVGEVGYLITGVKDVRQSKVGDTITNQRKPATERWPATPTRSRWSSAGSTRSTAATTPTCARRSTS